MSSRGAILLAIGMLVLGLLLGAFTGGVAGFFIGQGSRLAFSRNVTPIQPGQVAPYQPGQPRQSPFQRSVPPSTNAVSGARIDQVVAGSPAANAGLQPGDVITAVGGTAIDANHSLANLIQASKPGDTVNLSVTRGSQSLTINIVLGASPQNSSHAYLGISYTPLSSGGSRFRQPNG